MTRKISYIILLTVGAFLLIYGCASSAPLPIEVQATSILVSDTPTDEVKTPTQNGLSIYETERVATVSAIQTASTIPRPLTHQHKLRLLPLLQHQSQFPKTIYLFHMLDTQAMALTKSHHA